MIGTYTAERVSAHNQFDNYLVQRHLFAYNYASEQVSGRIMEIGCGEGYGYSVLKEKVDHYVGIDKINVNTSGWINGKADFFRMKVPHLQNIPSNIFDFIIAFQVIEHIKDDSLFLSEISRVLKKGGQLLLSTPNRKTSLTRNPWHIREYDYMQLAQRLQPHFSSVTLNGLNTSETLQTYLAEHKAQVARILRWDVLKLEQRLPRQFLKIPYNMFNQFNKVLMFKRNTELLNRITADDFILGDITEESLDLFVKAVK